MPRLYLNPHTSFRLISLWLLAIVTQTSLSQTLISGVVNDYSKITTITGPVLDVLTTTGFSAGDKILVIQMKGATIDMTSSIDYGDILAYNGAGTYEFATIDNIGASTIELTAPLCNTYDVLGCVQIVRVAVYADAEVVAPGVTAPAWNGTFGGIVAIECSSSLTLSDDIDVSALGFRGGIRCDGGFSCADLSWFSGPGLFGPCAGGQKGEAVAEYIMNQEFSRGKLGNGGGGSNQGNCGAGGGANFGTGGQGGDFWSGCFPSSINGIGGQGLDYSTGDKVYLGGGGGGGFRDNGQPTAEGQPGGGIILIESPDIIGSGGDMIANGGDVTLITNDEGAGGGGGGGSIILRTSNITGPLNLQADGGDGGDTQNFLFSSNCHGPGGGGGGGYIATSLGAWPAGIMTSSVGGDAGQILHTTGSCGFPSTHMATAGTIGGEAFMISDPVIAPVVDLGPDTSICDGAVLTLDAGPDWDSVIWSDGSMLQTLDISLAGIYYVEAWNGCGVARDTINLGINPLPAPDLGSDLSFCLGDSAVLDVNALGLPCTWSTGEPDCDLTVNAAGLYWVEVTDANGCVNRDTMEVLDVFDLPVVDLGLDQIVCAGVEVNLDAGPGFASYDWSTGNFGQFLSIIDSGQYQVTVIDDNGCINMDSMLLSYLPIDSCESLITMPNAFTPNGDGLNDIFRAVIGGADITSFSMLIFNRWGETIYQSQDYFDGWDGTFQGKPAELGTYIYLIEAQGVREGISQRIERTGTLTLMR